MKTEAKRDWSIRPSDLNPEYQKGRPTVTAWRSVENGSWHNVGRALTREENKDGYWPDIPGKSNMWVPPGQLPIWAMTPEERGEEMERLKAEMAAATQTNLPWENWKNRRRTSVPG